VVCTPSPIAVVPLCCPEIGVQWVAILTPKNNENKDINVIFFEEKLVMNLYSLMYDGVSTSDE